MSAKLPNSVRGQSLGKNSKLISCNYGTEKIYYSYDNSDRLISMNLDGKEYFYIRNAQGDIIGLYDKSGAEVVSYVYDSWGKILSIDGTLKDSVGVKNPYLYRGYRYDTETGLYYLQSRYYNPDWGRFINADGVVGQTGELLSHNIFAYCQGNPISYSDTTGYNKTSCTDYGGGGGIAIPLGYGGISDCLKGLGYAVIGIATVAITKIVSISTTRYKPQKPTVIYRSGSGSNTNLTPRPVDTGGLSFYRTPPKGKYVTTTVEAVNSTGLLKAVIDGPNHVSVMPKNLSTMSSWIASRPNAQTSPHLYTSYLKAIVWDSK